MKIAILTLLICFSLPGCRKFFDQRPDNNSVNPQTLKDFDEILNSDSMATTNFMLADIMSDDASFTDAMVDLDTASYFSRAYRWADHIWNDGDADMMYSAAYRRILQTNIVLGKLDQIEGENSLKENLRSEAYINRAWYYLQLVNLYGSDYVQSSAGTDLGVPVILVPDANRLPFRATVSEVYNQILADLNSAVNNETLPATGATVKRPGRAAGYALLARTYLYMGKFENAEKAADTALTLHNQLLNYTGNYTAPAKLADLKGNPEILLSRICIDYSFYSKYLSALFGQQDFIGLFSNDDSRLSAFFTADRQYVLQNFSTLTFNYSVGVPEVLLTKAECLARRGEDAQAINLLNQLRQNRLKEYQPLELSGPALPEVLKERRRELFFHGGLRLFDLKRLNRETDFKQNLYRLRSDSIVLATITPQSPRYLMEFSPLIIANNPNMKQNPR